MIHLLLLIDVTLLFPDCVQLSMSIVAFYVDTVPLKPWAFYRTLVKCNMSLHDHLHIITRLGRPHRTEVKSTDHLHTQHVCMWGSWGLCICLSLIIHLQMPNVGVHHNDPYVLVFFHGIMVSFKLYITHTHTHDRETFTVLHVCDIYKLTSNHPFYIFYVFKSPQSSSIYGAVWKIKWNGIMELSFKSGVSNRSVDHLVPVRSGTQ